MFRKVMNSVALAALLVAGVGVSQAQAVTPFVDSDYVAGASIGYSFDSDDTTTVVIPDGISHFGSQESWQLTESFLTAHAGQTLTYTVSVTDPDGIALSKSMGMLSETSAGYMDNVDGWLGNGTPGGSVQVDYQNARIVIPSNATGYSGYFRPSVDVNAQNFSTGGTLKDGTWTIIFRLFADGSDVTNASGVNADNLNNNVDINGNSTTFPTGTTSASFNSQVCADPTKIAVGDTLKSEFYLNGTLSPDYYSSWRTRNQFRSASDQGYRTGSYGTTVTVTQYDITNGLSASVGDYRSDLTPGTLYEAKYKLYNSTTGADVSGDCAPAKPSAPTALFSANQVRVTGTLSFGSGYESKCYLYDKANPTVVVRSSWANSGAPGSDQYSCNLSGTITGHTYVVKFQSNFYGKTSPMSDASADVFIPAGGYTITTSYAGVVGAGKVVKVSDNNIPIEDLGSYTQSISDGKGGVYTAGNAFSCAQRCGTTSFRIRHISNNTLDTTFGGTGSIVLNSFTPQNASVYSMGYYGTSKDKWLVPVTGYTESFTDNQVQLIFGNIANSTTTSKIVSQTSLNSVCNAAATGYSMRPGYSAQLNAISAPTANPFLQLTCWKQYAMADSTMAWTSIQVLVAVDPATGTLTAKAALGTPSAAANAFQARYTINPGATGNDPMITFFVGSYLYTAYNQNNMSFTGTVADHSIIRVKADGTVISTATGAWGTNGGSSSTDMFPTAPQVNSGTIFTVLRSGMTSSLVKFTSTGGAATPVAIDQSKSTILNGIVVPISGYPTPSNENLIPVSVQGMNEMAAGWVNATTGELVVGEKLAYTNQPGNGNALIWVAGSDKNTYAYISASAAPNYLTVLKWIDSRYVAPSGPVPTVTSKNLNYSKNTPAAGTKVTLTGTNLSGVTAAKIGGVTAAIGTKSATSLVLTVPNAAAAGTVDIVLTTSSGNTTVGTFTYVGNGVNQDVTITTAATSGTVGDADVALAATVSATPADAGTVGAVTWSSVTPTVCSVTAQGSLTYLAAGTCTVKATAAASGLLLSGNATKNITVSAGTQTITFVPPTSPQVDLDGIDLVVSSSSGLGLTFSTSTPNVCSVDDVAHVIATVAGDCVVTATQAGNGSWLQATASLTVTFATADTTPVVDLGDATKPATVAKTGVWVLTRGIYVQWNRTKGILAVKHGVVYTGPITATATFKIGSKTYTCVSNYGVTKAQSSVKRLTVTSTNICGAAKESAALTALKKSAANTAVKITIVRDMRVPTTYAKYRVWTKTIYVKLG